ncbi:AraC family transcriptional regulator [Phenylobacterium montanum]|uniref:AraC family transcriptional regulator n=1 Tax=Phenylobacterium montanum TaxID=2823693 RepID=A0A975G025_9CAUL|nr:AraC family transcriptional regulator [Caulobacter sp. S6]QUD88648.1 AraC family transcriptional regulator [Caulobacter sp. S6]
MATDPPRISTQILVHVVDQIRARGVDPGDLLRSHGVSAAALDDIELMAPLATYVALFEKAAAAVGDPHFGLKAAQATDAGALGALSFMFMSAPTLREALAGFTRFLDVLQEGTLLEVRPQGTQLTIAYQIRDSRITARRQDAEYSIGSTYHLIKEYARRFTPIEVYFEHERVGAYQVYADYFGCDVFFGQPLNAIVFNAEILDARSPRLSTRLYPIVTAHLQAAMSERGTPSRLSERVSRLLTDARIARSVTAEEIAGELQLSVHAMGRRLAVEGMSFRKLLLDRRMEAACRLLQEGAAPIGEVSLRLGYGENASFTRAFRRKFGLTPDQFRRGERP